MALSLKDRIYTYFRARPNVWIASATLERIVQEKTKYIASNASRQCRQLAMEKKLQRQERLTNGKMLAWYRYSPEEDIEILSRRSIKWFNSLVDNIKVWEQNAEEAKTSTSSKTALVKGRSRLRQW